MAKSNGTECVIGYLHRGVEKIGENRTYQQFAPYVDRMIMWPRFRTAWATGLAIEKTAEYRGSPARKRRRHSHRTESYRQPFAVAGTHALDIGAITPVFLLLREREGSAARFRNYCGARLTTHAFRIAACNMRSTTVRRGVNALQHVSTEVR